MGYGSDISAEMEVMEAINEWNIKNGMWTQRDGSTISIRKMTKRHIKNCIAMLERGNSPFAEEWIHRFEGELAFREYIEKIVAGQL